MVGQAYYAIGLNFHQPYDNLKELCQNSPWELKQILLAYERAVRHALSPEARLHIAFSGTLLMQLTDPQVQERAGHILDLPDLLHQFRSSSIEFLGSGYTHPVFPIIPAVDWEAQLGRYLDVARPALGRNWFPGFWPPEMGFCAEMIPCLKRCGYRYVVVDCEYIEPLHPMRWEEIRYRPHIARHGGEEIVVVPRDREISNAQLSGFDPGWFTYELGERTKYCTDFSPLVTSWSDGENGGWFRNLTEHAGFWGHFFQPMLERQRTGASGLSQISINEYLDRFGAAGEVRVHPGAWNTGGHNGRGFVQWSGSLLQKRGLEELRRVSGRYHDRRWALGQRGRTPQEDYLLDDAYWRILRAETSCNFYWGSSWVHRAFDDLEEAERIIDQVHA